MPPKNRFQREDIIQTALDLVREGGMDALTARSLAGRLGSSVKPIFGLFQNMEEVQQEVLYAAYGIYQSYLQREMSCGQYPPYKASGMGYIRFAGEEKELFKLLFMRDRTGERIQEDGDIQPLLELIQRQQGISPEEARLFHLEMWIYVHGIASMIATNYLSWDMDFASNALTDSYIGLKYRFSKEGRSIGSDSNR